MKNLPRLRQVLTRSAQGTLGRTLATGTLAATLGLGAVACDPLPIEPTEPFMSSCNAPLKEGEDPDKLRAHNKVTEPWVPRQLTQNVAEPWSSGRALAVHGAEVYAVDRDNGTLVVMDANNQLAVKRTIPVGARPEQVVVGPNGDAWVSVRHGGVVAYIEAGAEKVTQELQVGVEPIGVALSPTADKLFVTVAGDKNLTVVDTSSRKIVQVVETKQERPRAVTAVMSPSKAELTVTVIDQNSGAVRLRAMSSGKLVTSRSVALRRENPSHRLGFSKKKLKSWRATGGAVNPETGRTLVSHVIVSPGDATSLLQSSKSELSGQKSPTKKVSSGGYGSAGDACDPGAPIRPIEVSLTDVGDNFVGVSKQFSVADQETGRAFLARFDQPSDVNHHPKVSLAFMTNYGTDNVLVLNTGRKDVMEFPIAELKVGQAPKAIAFSADGKRAFVLNQHGFSVSEVDLQPLLKLTVAGYEAGKMPPQTKPLTLTPTRTVQFAKDPASPLLQKGRRLFTFTGNSKISQSQRFTCASCHLEGAEDKMVWFITDGPRQTPSLAGRLAGTAPFNWVGSEKQLQGNMDRTIKRMGGHGLAKDELAALEQFMLHGLVAPPNPNFNGTLTDAQARGKKLFNDPTVGCASCHVGGDGTDGQNWDVGTVTSEEKLLEQFRATATHTKARKLTFNTPSLRGAFYTGPYLHDGSAKTLMDVLNKTSKTMGKTSHLSYQQKQDLVAYLKTL